MADQFLIDSPYTPFTIKNQFKAISNGKVYIGEVDKDPLNPSQQIQVYVVNESGTNVPVSQPISLNAGGYLVYNGQVSKFVTLEPYSMVVLNNVDSEMWRVDDISKVDPDNITASNVKGTTNGGSVQDFIDISTFKTVADMKSFANHIVGSKVVWQGYYSQSDGGSNWGVVKSGAHVEDGGSIFSIDTNTYIKANIVKSKINVKKFGAKGDGTNNDTVRIQAAIDYGKAGSNIFHPEGIYLISNELDIWTGQELSGLTNKLSAVSEIRGTGEQRIIGVANATAHPQFTELKYVKIKGLAFSGFNCKVTYVDKELEDTYFVEWEISDCYFKANLAVGLNGIFLTSTIRDNSFFCKKHIEAIADFDSPNIREANVLQIIRNRFDAATVTASVNIDSAYAVTLQGNIWQTNQVVPLRLSGCSPVEVTGNHFESNTSRTLMLLDDDSVTQNKWALINFSNNYISHAGLVAIAEVQAAPGRHWVDFYNNYIATPGGYLTVVGVDGAKDTAVRKAEANFWSLYAGTIKNGFYKYNWSPTQSKESVKFVNSKDYPYEFNNENESVVLEGVDGRYGLPGRHALLSAQNIDSNTTIGVKSNRNVDFFRVVGNWSGSAYLNHWLKIRANDGLFTAPAIYTLTSGSSANVVVTTDGSLLRSTSSRRFKENEEIAYIDTSWVLKVTPKTFDYTDTLSQAGDKGVIGYIAEDLSYLDKRAATYDSDGREDGNEWNYILICAIEEIKKLRRELDDLKV